MKTIRFDLTMDDVYFIVNCLAIGREEGRFNILGQAHIAELMARMAHIAEESLNVQDDPVRDDR